MDICIVLGIGVAVIVKTSIFDLYCFIFSFAFTPNLCSSSIISSPMSLNSTSLLNNLCVPTTMSTSPNFNFLITSFWYFALLNLFNISTFIGKSFILSLNSSYCCCAKTVVGTRYATCLWSITALNAALIATSVFPYPTSPHKSLSIGLRFSISFFTSSIHLNWSSVSWYGNWSSNCCCQGVSGLNAYPFAFSLFAYNSINSLATALKFFFTFSFVFFQSLLLRLFNGKFNASPPVYFLIASNWLVGTYKIASSLYFNLI